jgi:hypothetical protein
VKRGKMYLLLRSSLDRSGWNVDQPNDRIAGRNHRVDQIFRHVVSPCGDQFPRNNCRKLLAIIQPFRRGFIGNARNKTQFCAVCQMHRNSIGIMRILGHANKDQFRSSCKYSKPLLQRIIATPGNGAFQ